MMKLEILWQIMQHLINNPGEFRWNHCCSIWNMDVIVLHCHLQWLRHNGFTENQQGKVYRTDRAISELSIALGLPETHAPQRQTYRSQGCSASTVHPVSAAPEPKRPRKAKPTKAAPPKLFKPPKPPRALKPNCYRRLITLKFQQATIWEISDMLKLHFQEQYSDDAIVSAIRKIPTIRVQRRSGESFARYST